jgi:hypothetical protein
LCFAIKTLIFQVDSSKSAENLFKDLSINGADKA